LFIQNIVFDNKMFLGYQPCQVVESRKNNVSRTISVLVLRVLMCLEKQSVSYSYAECPETHNESLKGRSLDYK
jgi:hypothetical protein